MEGYTEFFEFQAETLEPWDNNYEEQLQEIASQFRDFDYALTAFMVEHGYTGESSDVATRVKFLHEKFNTTNVKKPHNFKEWVVPDKKTKKIKNINRLTAYTICFAFALDVDETNQFFKRVRFERGFDCHVIEEAVYYFCIKNRLPYEKAQDIIKKIPEPQKLKALPQKDWLYTQSIVDYIDQLQDKEQLVQYIVDNLDDFQYHNVAALESIQQLWEAIAKKDDGLAVKEAALIERSKGNESAIVTVLEKTSNAKGMVTAASTWDIFCQIMGCTKSDRKTYSVDSNRTLTPMPNKNVLLPLSASNCFPNRQNIDKLIRGEWGSNETVRKMLILLSFYAYWAVIKIQNRELSNAEKRANVIRGLDTINNRLQEAGYPELYAGNPYDWIFMWSMNAEEALLTFRKYMFAIMITDDSD